MIEETNPLLDRATYTRFDEIRPEHVVPAITRLIADREAAVADVVAARPTDFASVWSPIERASTALDEAWATVAHLNAVLGGKRLRRAHDEAERLIIEHEMRIEQDAGLFAVTAALAESPEFADLAADDRAAVSRALRNARLSGATLEGEAQARFAANAVELSGLGNAFSAAVLDATEAWSEHVSDASALRGVPEADMATFAAAAEAKGLDGLLITLRQPSVAAILTFAEDRELRRRVHHANGTRASDRGPNAHEFDNGPRIARILELRDENARLLGFPSHVERSLSTKMAESGDQVLAFLRDLATRARPFAEAEFAELRAFAAAELGIDDLQPWDVSFASERLRRARHDVDETEIRSFLPADRVLEGWTSLLRDLFGLTLVARPDAPTWHPDAVRYDVLGDDGETIGGLHLDLHARSGKRGGAWVAQARPLMVDGDERRTPLAFLSCNFPAKDADGVALLSHDDVTTLLHETGHALHHVLGAVERPIIGGLAGHEWDAVELPSQLMEDFAWDRDVLKAMSGRTRDGATLSDALFDRMIAARDFQSGLFLLRQIEFGMADIILHSGTMGRDPMVVQNAVRDEIAVLRPPEDHRVPHSFGHVFSGGYSAGYYSYLWAELLAADAFGRFAEAGVVNRATGDALRNEILSRGASRPAIENFRAFMGRDPDPAAMLRRNGLVR